MRMALGFEQNNGNAIFGVEPLGVTQQPCVDSWMKRRGEDRSGSWKTDPSAKATSSGAESTREGEAAATATAAGTETRKEETAPAAHVPAAAGVAPAREAAAAADASSSGAPETTRRETEATTARGIGERTAGHTPAPGADAEQPENVASTSDRAPQESASEADAATLRAELATQSREQLIEEVVRLRRSLEIIQKDRQEQVDFQSHLLKSVGQAIVCSDLTGKISYWNFAAADIYGWTEEEAVGQNILTVLRAANSSLAEAAPKIMENLTQGQKWRGEWSVITKSGRVVDIMVVDTPVMDERGQLVGIIGVSTDITELKRKEAEILRLNAELEERVRERTRQLEHANSLLREEVQEHLRAREHLHMVAKDMEESRAKIMQQAEKSEKLVVELRAARTEAESASRLKSQFLACMSHEIRTPMNAVIGMTNLILSTPLLEEQRQYVETIRTSGDALLSIIDDILDLSKIEAGELALEPRPFSPLLCVEEAVSMVAVKAQESGLELVTFVDPSVPPFALSDPFRFRQVLTNLLSNALKFTEVGEIVIQVTALPWGAQDPQQQQPQGPWEAHRSSSSQQAGRAEEAGSTGASSFSTKLAFRSVAPVQLSPHPPSQRLLVTVRDTGIGIPPDRMTRLFRPFSQGDASTTRRFGGTGLGLVISKQLVEMLGGHIWVESEGENRGSTFSFTLALYPNESGQNPFSAPLPQGAPRSATGTSDSHTRIVKTEAAAGKLERKTGESSKQQQQHGLMRQEGQEQLAAVPQEHAGHQSSEGIPVAGSPKWVPPAPEALLRVGPLEPLAGLHACVVDRNASSRAFLGRHLEALGLRVTLCSTAGSLLDLLTSAASASPPRKGLGLPQDAPASAAEREPGAKLTDPDVLLMDIEVPGMHDIMGARLVQYQTPRGLSKALERRRLIKMCPYGTANQVVQRDGRLEEQHQELQASKGEQSWGGAFSAVISKPVRQTHLTKALLLLFSPAEAKATHQESASGVPASPGAQGAGGHAVGRGDVLDPSRTTSSHSQGALASCPVGSPPGGAADSQQEELMEAAAQDRARSPEPMGSRPPAKRARKLSPEAEARTLSTRHTSEQAGGPRSASSFNPAEEAAPGEARPCSSAQPSPDGSSRAAGSGSLPNKEKVMEAQRGRGFTAPSASTSVTGPVLAAEGDGRRRAAGSRAGASTAAVSAVGGVGLGLTMAASSVSVSGTLLITGPKPLPQESGLVSGMALEHPLSILLVEDNLVNQRVASRMLSHMGYAVDVAGNGLEAIKALEKKHYDLVFMDIQMPVMDGIEATQRIHAMATQRGEGRPRPRIVAMTANVLHSDRQQCLSVGMDGFLSKPIRISDLVAVLEQTSLLPQQQQQLLQQGQPWQQHDPQQQEGRYRPSQDSF